MTEEDAQTAALREYFEDNRPAGYGASFRAGWEAGRQWSQEERNHRLMEWEALAAEKNWGYVHDERMDALLAETVRLREAMREARRNLPMWEASVGIERAKSVLDDALASPRAARSAPEEG